MSALIWTLVCPLCSQPPGYVLAGGRQAFCVTDDCKVITWDMTLTLDEIFQDVGFIDLSGRGR